MVKRAQPTSSFEQPYTDSTTRTYDASGNVDWGLHTVQRWDTWGNLIESRHSRTRSYYGADERLRYHQERTLTGGSSVSDLGGWEEYRYDPLGRRIMVRRNADGLCNQPDQVQCASHVTRFVWSGDNLLWEVKAVGGNTANLEAESSTGVLYGRVSYFHAGGIDRPLVITKAGRPSVIPHQNWRGQFVLGTYASGARSDCTSGQTSGCEPIAWPGHRTTAWHRESKAPDIRTWYGGLVDKMRDASGQMYMRNRYYDPATGQFTQPDPIGLAGGLNSYGFAAGDPVSYSDPYGLRVEFQSGAEGDRLRRLWNDTKNEAREAMRSDDRAVAAAGRQLFNAMQEIDDSRTYTLRVGTHSEGSSNPVGRVQTEARGGRLANQSRMSFSVHPSRDFFGLSDRMQIVALAHEVGHAWTAMNFARSVELHEQYTNVNANNFENSSRRITGCGGYRPSHNVGGTRC